MTAQPERPEPGRAATEQITRSEAETMAVARALATDLRAGDILLLSGNLGAGKTAFVRGLAQGLGVDPEEVSSPTFTLIHEYRGGRLALYHVDLYRLERAATDDLGLDELGVRDGVLAIEWPNRLTHTMPGAMEVALEILDDETRRITCGP
jgi:tRNA threonylcarbamoyladenosine biosynthesis protein TsaE